MLFMQTVLQKLSGLGDANNTSPSSCAGSWWKAEVSGQVPSSFRHLCYPVTHPCNPRAAWFPLAVVAAAGLGYHGGPGCEAGGGAVRGYSSQRALALKGGPPCMGHLSVCSSFLANALVLLSSEAISYLGTIPPPLPWALNCSNLTR